MGGLCVLGAMTGVAAPDREACNRHGGALDALNFFLADVRGGLGAFVGIFLVMQAQWDPAMIGTVLTVSGLIGISLHAPIGALIDSTRFKRGLIILGVALLAVSAVAIERAPIWPVVLAADIILAVLGAVFAPTVAAITLGLVCRRHLAARLGRNAAFDRAGNLFIAGFAGLVGWWLSPNAVFYLVPLFAIPLILVALSVPAAAIDHERARGLDDSGPGRLDRPSGWSALADRRLLVLAAVAALLHFANAPMLALVGQKLALEYEGQATLLMSACVMIPHLATIPVALLLAPRAARWGWKPLLVAAAVALPIRGALFALTDDPLWLIAIQILDGIGLGLFDTLLPLVLADIARGTGRYNVSRGVVGTVQGIGGSLSNVVAGFIVVLAGYSVAFLALAAVAAAAVVLVLAALPETQAAVRDAGPDDAVLAPAAG